MNNIKEAYKKGYRVLSDGTPISSNGELKGRTDNKGYMSICVRVNGIKKNVYIHRLQAYQKYGDLIFGVNMEVRHLNGDKTDNSWINIAIGTHSDNMMDIPKHIRLAKALIATSKVRKYNKLEVINYYNEVGSYSKTMQKFNISSKGTLHFILNK